MIIHRGKGKDKGDVGPNEICKEFKKKYKSLKLDDKTIRNVINTYNELLIDAMIFKGIDVRMPYRLGNLRVAKKRNTIIMDNDGNIIKNYVPLDYKKTLDYWEKTYPDKTFEEIRQIKNKKVVRNLNYHTDGYKVFFMWDKTTTNIPNQGVYRIKICRKTNRYLAECVKKNKKLIYNYFE